LVHLVDPLREPFGEHRLEETVPNEQGQGDQNAGDANHDGSEKIMKELNG